MAHKSVASLPREIARRIMRRAKKGGPLVLTVNAKGKPSRVYGYGQYQKMKSLPSSVKPWEHRKTNVAPNPLGAVKGKVIGRLSRDEIYD